MKHYGIRDSGDRAGDDVQRTIYKYHEIWRVLGVPGRLEIAWTIDNETQRLRLTWTETSGPAAQAPIRRSFGTRMMESLGQQLCGQVQLAYHPTGFVYILDVPLSSLTAKA